MEMGYGYIVTVSSAIFAIIQVAAKADQKMRFDIELFPPPVHGLPEGAMRMR